MEVFENNFRINFRDKSGKLEGIWVEFAGILGKIGGEALEDVILQ